MASISASNSQRWKQRVTNNATRIAEKKTAPPICPMLLSTYHVLGLAGRLSATYLASRQLTPVPMSTTSGAVNWSLFPAVVNSQGPIRGRVLP